MGDNAHYICKYMHRNICIHIIYTYNHSIIRAASVFVNCDYGMTGTQHSMEILNDSFRVMFQYGSGHKGEAVLLSGFAINW